MLIEMSEPLSRNIHREGKWHLKAIGTTEQYTKKGNAYLRVTCISADDRMFCFPLYLNSNDSRLLHELARAIGYENVTSIKLGDEVIDTEKFRGGFFHAILAKYDGDNEAYESGYYIKSIWSSRRRYDVTQSSTFKRVRVSNRVGSTYKG